MSVFSEGNMMGEAKQCRRDIESEIKQANTELKKESQFLKALYEYMEDSFPYHRSEQSFTLSQLVGLLEISVRAISKKIDRLTAELEMEKK